MWSPLVGVFKQGHTTFFALYPMKHYPINNKHAGSAHLYSNTYIQLLGHIKFFASVNINNYPKNVMSIKM